MAHQLFKISLSICLVVMSSGCALLGTSCPLLNGSGWTNTAAPLQPIVAESSSSKIKLHTTTQGTGSPVLLIHGFGSSSYTWRHVVGPLSQNHTVITVDLKGFGHSPKPFDNAYSAKDQAKLIVDLIEERDLHDLVIVGHSFGGGVALLTTLELQHREISRLSGLVLVDSMAYPQKLPQMISLLQMPVVGNLGLKVIPAEYHIGSFLKKTYHRPHLITQPQLDTYTNHLKRPGARYALQKTAEQIIPDDFSETIRQYQTIHVPTLILWGRYDTIVPPDVGERLHFAIPSSQFVLLDEAGHMPHEENPRAMIKPLQQFIDAPR